MTDFDQTAFPAPKLVLNVKRDDQTTSAEPFELLPLGVDELTVADERTIRGMLATPVKSVRQAQLENSQCLVRKAEARHS